MDFHGYEDRKDTMLSHLLLVVETDKEVGHSLAHALWLARASGAHITLLGLLDSSSNKSHFVDPLDWHMRKLEAELRLKELGQKLRKTGAAVHTDILDGSRARNLLQYAQAEAVDLIIVVKRTERISELIHNLIKRTTIPVLVLQDAEGTQDSTLSYRKLLVPLDGSQRAEYSLSVAAQFAQFSNAQIVVAHILHKPDMPRSTPPSAADHSLANQIVENNRNEAIPYLKRIAARLPGKVETRLLVSDNVAVALANLAEKEEIDLIVLGAHGHSGAPQQPYGNIANNLMTYSRKPVLVVQDMPEAQTATTQVGRRSVRMP